MSTAECKAKVYNPESTPWEQIGDAIVAIEEHYFGAQGFSRKDLESWFCDPTNTVVLLTDKKSQKVVGFTFAQPSEDAYNIDPFFYIHQLGRRGSKDTAYISDTAIDPNYTGQGLVVPLMTLLEQTLKERGYQFIERDAAVVNGYADKIEKVYRRQQRILDSSTHDSVFGPQRFFRIKL